MKISDLMALTEASTGYVGGNYVDEMPHLSLEECVGRLPVVILENQLELAETANAQNDAMVEAAVAAFSTGSQDTMNSLIEASFADIKAKIKKIFDSIIKFLKSIVAKLTLQIDKIKMSGHQLYAKYKDSPMLREKKDGLTVQGYKFSKNENLFPAASSFETDVEKLIKTVGGGKIMTPDEFAAAYKTDIKDKSKEEKKGQKAIDDMKNVGRATRVFNMAKALTGSSKISEGSWQADLKTELYGEKVELKYGTDFDKDSVADMLKEPKNLNLIKDEYVKLEQAVNRYRDEIQKKVDEMEREASNTDNTSEKNNGLSLCTGYFNAYMGIISDAYGTINVVKNIKYNFEKAKLDQAKTLFGKILSYKVKKEDASDVDGIEEFQLEL